MRPYAMYVRLYNGRLPTENDPRYLELVRMSKYRILAVPDVNPAKCANCGASKEDGRKYIDFGLQVDWHGCVFLCSICLGDIARNIGLFDQHLEEIKRLREELEKNIFTAQQGLEIEGRVAHIFEEVKEYFDRLHPAGNHPLSDQLASMEPDPEESNGKTTSESSGQTTGVHKRVTESATGSGSKDIPSLAKLLSTD